MVGHTQSPAKLGMYMHRSLLWKHDTEVQFVPISCCWFVWLLLLFLSFSNIFLHPLSSYYIFWHLLALSACVYKIYICNYLYLYIYIWYAWLYINIYGARSWSGCEIARAMLGISSSPRRPQMWHLDHLALGFSIALGVALGSKLKGDFGEGIDSLLDPWSSDQRLER